MKEYDKLIKALLKRNPGSILKIGYHELTQLIKLEFDDKRTSPLLIDGCDLSDLFDRLIYQRLR